VAACWIPLHNHRCREWASASLSAHSQAIRRTLTWMHRPSTIIHKLLILRNRKTRHSLRCHSNS